MQLGKRCTGTRFGVPATVWACIAHSSTPNEATSHCLTYVCLYSCRVVHSRLATRVLQAQAMMNYYAGPTAYSSEVLSLRLLPDLSSQLCNNKILAEASSQFRFRGGQERCLVGFGRSSSYPLTEAAVTHTCVRASCLCASYLIPVYPACGCGDVQTAFRQATAAARFDIFSRLHLVVYGGGAGSAVRGLPA